MNDRLVELLRPWAQISTWNSLHPLDERRFHQALKACFDELGTEPSYEDFRRAIEQLVQEHHATLAPEKAQEDVERFAMAAEHIANYLADNA